ncbi:helix-turn-helix protein [Labedaea rhizosphaerae]|uniref:Helix-turn-helix protein n=2 Tax=Labedaea rhizosphaerae TaxID=598644 RepID=A0A4V3CZ32_LABRH|nr:helix-turn-helix protein [Labedaea rhizosphaerae]
MRPNPAIWHSDAVLAAVNSGDAGAIIRAVRLAKHQTLADLAALCGYSVSTLSRLERGKQPLRDVAVLRSLVDALDIPPSLLGLADTPPRSVHSSRPAAMVTVILPRDEEIDPMRRRTLLAGLTGLAGSAVCGIRPASASPITDPIRALEHALLTPPASGIPTGLAQLHEQLAATREVFQQGRYTDVATSLLRLLPTAHATRHEVSGDEAIVAADRHLSDLYTLTAELMVKIGNDPLAWTTADRAMQAAHATDDILTHASASRTWAIVLRRAGRADTAQNLVVDTAAMLQPHLHRGPEHLSVYGSLLSTAAYTAAVDGHREDAHTLIGEAVQAANRLGVDANHRFTAFGPTGVDLYRISIARVLGDSGTAVETARGIDPRAIHQVERLARYWSDVARSFYQWDKPEQCYRALLRAEHASPDEVRYRKPIQHITMSLLRQPTAKSMPGIQAFARRNGVPVA